MSSSTLDWADDEEGYVPPRLGEGTIDDADVRWASAMVDFMDIVDQLEAWKQEDRKGPGGRPESFSFRPLLVGMVLASSRNRPMHAMAFHDVLFMQISPESRRFLEIPDPPDPGDVLGWEASYQSVRRRFKTMCALMDPSVLPKNRRLDRETFDREVGRLRSETPDETLARNEERLRWFANRVLEASIQLPREFRGRWDGSGAVDATVVPAFARPPVLARGKKRGQEAEVITSSVDPDGGWYYRKPDERDRPAGPKRTTTKAVYGYELSIMVSGDLGQSAGVPLPSLVMGMAVLHKPGVEPGMNGFRAVESVHGRGHPAGYLAGDRAYSNARPEDYQSRVAALGHKPVHDFRSDQLGVMAEVQGLIQVEGNLYCPAMPEALIHAARGYHLGDIDEETFAKLIEARQPYRAHRNGTPGPDGEIRWLCPAAGVGATARCVIKPKSEQNVKGTPVRIRPSDELQANPTKACRQLTITAGPEAGAKFAQELAYASPEWRRVYATLRNSIEGMNGFMKDSAFEAMADSQRRRIRGTAPQTVLVAFQVLAANLRKVEGFLKAVKAGAAGVFRPRRRPRTTPSPFWRPPALEKASGGPSPPAA